MDASAGPRLLPVEGLEGQRRQPDRTDIAIVGILVDLKAKQQPLGEPFQSALFDNLWGLYSR